MVPSDLGYHAWFKSCASFFENVSKACSKLNTSNLSLVLVNFLEKWECSPLSNLPLPNVIFGKLEKRCRAN